MGADVVRTDWDQEEVAAHLCLMGHALWEGGSGSHACGLAADCTREDSFDRSGRDAASTAGVEGVGGWACSELARLLNIQVEEDVVAYVVGAAVAAANEKLAKEEVDAFLNSFSVEEGRLRDLEAFATTLRSRISLIRQA